jgi:hypothetical protein
MPKDPRFTRIFIALGVSGVVNVAWLVFDGLIAHAQHPVPKLAWIVDKLGTPGGTIADWLAPSGHTVGTVLAGVLIAIRVFGCLLRFPGMDRPQPADMVAGCGRVRVPACHSAN